MDSEMDGDVLKMDDTETSSFGLEMGRVVSE